jgi:urease accessory protein
MKGIGVLAVVLLAASAAEPALAHTGGGHVAGGGLWSGLLHPVTGLVHVLAMVTVGLLAAGLGGRALWLVPAAFLTMMAAGAAAAMAGLPLPHVELGIAASVVALGTLVAVRAGLPALAAAAGVALLLIG